MNSVVLRKCFLKASSLIKELNAPLRFKRTFSTTKTACQNSHNVNDENDSCQSYDIVISGGGMVGTAMACALGYEPLLEDKKILLLEAGPEKNYETLPEKYSNRVCALSLATADLLSSFGAWENICNMRQQPVKRMQVWDSCSDAMITFNQDDLSDNLAHIVENDVILAALNKQLQAIQDKINVKYQTKVRDYKFPKTSDASWVSLSLEDGEKIKTKLLIGADGIHSQARKAAKIHTVSLDYHQMGVVATLQLSEPTENNVAWQRFLPTGPLAYLPLTDTLSSLVWTTTTENAKNLLQIPADSFVDAVNEAMWSEDSKDDTAITAGQFLDNLISTIRPEGTSCRQLPPTVVDIQEGSRAAFPLGLGHASHYVGKNLALIGDAAHRIHPLAGQGVNLGFGDVACLKEKITDAIYSGSDIGSLSYLLEYETERQRHIVPVMATIDGLNRLFGTDFSPLVVLRSLGLQATNAFLPVKEFLRNQATRR